MPISRIDIITMPPKTQEASQYKQNELTKSFSEQAQLQSGFQKELSHNSQQTVRTLKGENTEKRYDAKEKGNQSYEGQGSKKKHNQSKENKEIKTSNFDVKI